MKKIGLLGGSFDPIHFGHLNLALELMEKRGLDEIWFIPAKVNPHKSLEEPISEAHRLMMLGLALEEINCFNLSRFKIDETEIHRDAPSYTIDTLRILIAQHPTTQFYLLLGQDCMAGFSRWHLPEEIIALVPLLIGSRSGTWNIDEFECSSRIKSAIKEGVTVTRLMDISSTTLRQRLAQGLYCGHLIPHRVLHYIYENGLYLV
jgi:nicotinate-nucleotide adenylyltransferase